MFGNNFIPKEQGIRCSKPQIENKQNCFFLKRNVLAFLPYKEEKLGRFVFRKSSFPNFFALVLGLITPYSLGVLI